MVTIDVVSLYGQEPEAELLAALIPLLDEKVVVDVGAECGAFVAQMLRAGSTEVHAIEPEPQNVHALRARFAGDGRVHVHPVAASDADGELRLHRSVDPAGARLPYGHTLLDRPDTEAIAWDDTIAVDGRSLASLVESGEIPRRVGIVKIDAEGHDLAVVAGMGGLESDVVMVEHWTDLPLSLGPCPWATDEMVAALRRRGFSHFAFVAHLGEFTILKWNDGTVPPGHMGNLVFLHDRVIAHLLPLVLESATRLAESAVATGEMYASAARERLVLVDELQAECDRRLRLIEELDAALPRSDAG